MDGQFKVGDLVSVTIDERKGIGYVYTTDPEDGMLIVGVSWKLGGITNVNMSTPDIQIELIQPAI
jgi:hypothetical protein